MKINTSELRKLIREELQKTAAPMLKELVKESLLKNSINEVLVNLIAEAIVDKQELLREMAVTAAAEPEEEGTIRLTTKNLPPRTQLMAKSRLDERATAEIKSRYEQMMGGIPVNSKRVPAPGIVEDGKPDAQSVIAMLPETNTEGAPLRIDSIPEHLANALTKDYRQMLKNIHTSVK